MHPDAIWGLAWTSQNHLISSSADGHVRLYDPSQLARPLQDIQAHSLAISSLSCNSDGSRTLSTSLNGAVVFSDPIEGKVLNRFETSREKAASGEGGMYVV